MTEGVRCGSARARRRIDVRHSLRDLVSSERIAGSLDRLPISVFQRLNDRLTIACHVGVVDQVFGFAGG